MRNANTRPPCRIYLHPTAATSPSRVRAITQRTGLVVITGGLRSAAQLVEQPHPSDWGPFGGDAA